MCFGLLLHLGSVLNIHCFYYDWSLLSRVRWTCGCESVTLTLTCMKCCLA